MQGGTTQSYVGRGLSHATAPKRCPTTLAPFTSNAGRNDAIVRRAGLEPCHSAEAVPLHRGRSSRRMQGGTTQSYVGRGLSHATAPKRCPQRWYRSCRMQGGTTQSYVGRGLSHATAPKRCPQHWYRSCRMQGGTTQSYVGRGFSRASAPVVKFRPCTGFFLEF